MKIAEQTEQVAKQKKVLHPPTVYALLERSYLESQKKEQEAVGEAPQGALTVALSVDQSSKPILTFVSTAWRADLG